MWLVLTIILITTLIFYLKRNYTYLKRNNIPSPDPTWIVGNIGPVLKMSKHFGQMIDEWYKKYSDLPYFGYYKCLTPSICIRDPELIKNVLIKDFNSFAKNDFGFDEQVDPLLAHNPFLTTGERWKESRSILTPLFTANKVQTLFPLMARACDRLKSYIQKLGPHNDFNAKDLAGRFTADNIAMVSFSFDAEAFSNSNSEFRQKVRQIFEPTTLQAIQFMIILFMPSLVNLLKIRFLPKHIDLWIRKLVKANLESRKSIKLSQDDLLEMLVEQQTKGHHDEETIAGHALAFVSEGTETSSTLFGNAMYELARHPDIQQRLYEEVTEVLAHHNNNITYDAIQEMSYLDCVIQETLRIKPIMMTMHKVCTKSYKLNPLPGQTEGYVITEGMSITIPTYSLHFDPVYFVNPHEFDPDRHSEEQVKLRPKCVFIPFSEGPRMCMGQRLALAQIKGALAHVINTFEIKLSPNCKPFVLNPAQMLCTPIDPLLLNFVPRP